MDCGCAGACVPRGGSRRLRSACAETPSGAAFYIARIYPNGAFTQTQMWCRWQPNAGPPRHRLSRLITISMIIPSIDMRVVLNWIRLIESINPFKVRTIAVGGMS